FHRTVPVIGGKGPKGQVFNADLAGANGDAPDVLGASAVSVEPGQAAFTCPAPVAIHDDGNMAWHWQARTVVVGRLHVRFHPLWDVLDLKDFRFLRCAKLVSARDILVGQFLDACFGTSLVVFTYFFLGLQELDGVHRITTHVAHCDFGLLDALVYQPDEFLASLFCKLWDL